MSNEVIHPIPAVFDENSRILILGTIPSPKSREENFFYAHKGNRFWKVLSSVLNEEIPQDKDRKKCLLLRNNIAVWDVLQSCQIIGAQDSKIKNPVPNDFTPIFKAAKIKAVFTTGKKAWQIYQEYCFPLYGIPAISLPSTSGANVSYSFERLVAEYRKILIHLNENKLK